jgi:hypothetical protein
MLFWLKYGELECRIDPDIITIHKFYETYVAESLNIISYIVYGIIYRNGSAKKREYSTALYRLHIQNIRTNEPEIYLNMDGEIKPHRFFVIDFRI